MWIADQSLDQLVSVVRREALAGLLRGAPATVATIAARRRVPPDLFCHAAHAEMWRQQAGDPHGRAVSLGELEDIARVAWADVAGEGRAVRGVDAGYDDNE